MTFRKFVQIGRVVYLNEGPYKGKLALIVDIVDTNRALIDGPCSGVPRQEFRFSEMFLTKYMVKINRSQKTKGVRAAWEEAEINQKFAESLWNKNLKKDTLRSNMTDFDRYQLGRSKQMKNKIVKTVYFHLKKQNLRAKKEAKAKKAK